MDVLPFLTTMLVHPSWMVLSFCTLPSLAAPSSHTTSESLLLAKLGKVRRAALSQVELTADFTPGQIARPLDQIVVYLEVLNPCRSRRTSIYPLYIRKIAHIHCFRKHRALDEGMTPRRPRHLWFSRLPWLRPAPGFLVPVCSGVVAVCGEPPLDRYVRPRLPRSKRADCQRSTMTHLRHGAN